MTIGAGNGTTLARGDPMKLVHVYLNFPGTAKEAFEYYETVFRSKIVAVQTLGKLPSWERSPIR